jgi:transposase
METAEMPVQKGRRRLWSAEKKLALLQEWRSGLPLEEVCRKHGVQAVQLYKWRRQLEKGLADRGEMIPKSEVAGLQRKVDELERALGRKALEVDILKKFFEMKGCKLPDGM